MIYVAKIRVPAVTDLYRDRMEDAIIDILDCGSYPVYEEDEKGGVVRFLVTVNELKYGVKNCFKNVEVDHVSSFTIRWYNYHSNTWARDNYQLEADGSASVRRRNNDETDEKPVELNSISEEEFHKIFEEYFLGDKSGKLMQWD